MSYYSVLRKKQSKANQTTTTKTLKKPFLFTENKIAVVLLLNSSIWSAWILLWIWTYAPNSKLRNILIKLFISILGQPRLTLSLQWDQIHFTLRYAFLSHLKKKLQEVAMPQSFKYHSAHCSGQWKFRTCIIHGTTKAIWSALFNLVWHYQLLRPPTRFSVAIEAVCQSWIISSCSWHSLVIWK